MQNKQHTRATEKNRPDFKVGEVAGMLDTTCRTLRFYEEEGLLVPFRSAGGTRLYSESDIARLRVIQLLVRLDVPLRTVHELATARPESRSGDEASHKVFELLSELRLDIEKKKQECEDAEQEISSALQLIEQCFGCRNEPSLQGCKDCSVGKQRNTSHLFHLIWDQDKAGRKKRPLNC